MKKITLFIVAIALLSCSSKNTETEKTDSAKPSFDEVFYHLYSKYDVKNSLQEKNQIQVIKSPEGWEIIELSFNQSTNQFEEIARKLLWSAENKKFEAIDFEEHKEPYDVSQMLNDLRKTINNRYISSMENARYKFDNHTFYGYDGWTDDVLDHFASSNAESPKEKFTLAQAYLEGAFNVFERERDFEKVKKGLDLMKSLRNENSIKAFIGSILNKYANDVTGVYYNNEFLQLGYKKSELKQHFKKGLYKEEVLIFGKILLSSCPENGILFTSGDNDTYPLIYLQEIENYRTDVQIINSSLLQVPSYIAYLKEKGLKTKGDLDFYKNDLSGLMVVEASEVVDTNYFSLLKVKSVPTKTFGESRYAVFPRKIKYSLLKSLSIDGKSVHRSDVAGLDIIFSNNRPVCFAGNRGLSSIEKTQVSPVGLISVVKKMYSEDEWEDLENRTNNTLTDPMIAKVPSFEPDASIVNLVSFGYYYQLQKAINQNNDSLRDAIFNFYNKEFNKKGQPAYFRANVVSLFHNYNLEKEWVDATALEIADQLDQDAALIISKKIEQLHISDFSKLNNILRYYKELVNKSLIDPTRLVRQEEKNKSFLTKLVQEEPYFKLSIFSYRELNRTLNGKI